MTRLLLLLAGLLRSASCLLPRVIFADCDGTMLGPDHRLTQRTRETLRRLTAAGLSVIPATGRARAGPWTEHVLTEDALKGGQPGIFMNGCNVIDEEGLVSNSLLPPAVVAATLEFAASEPVTAAVYSGDEALVDTSNALTERLVGVGDAPVRQVDDLSVALGSTGKILLLFEESVDGVALRSALAGAVGEGAGLTQALSWMLEVVPSGVNKATAVRALLERWNISPEEAVAIGDGENDAEMLAFVGMGIAMGNGGAAAKAAAQHTVPSNREDGFSVAMEEHVLAQLDKA